MIESTQVKNLFSVLHVKNVSLILIPYKDIPQFILKKNPTNVNFALKVLSFKVIALPTKELTQKKDHSNVRLVQKLLKEIGI